ncbi:MAG: phasin family protein [Pseudomonadota bacterium]
MMHEKFPFADFDKLNEMFKMPELDKFNEMFKVPELDKMFDASQVPGMEGVVKAHEKNLTAAMEANKVALAGYQSVYKRQVAMIEEAMAQAKDAMGDVQGQPMTAEQAQKNMDAARVAFEKAVKDSQELVEMAQKASSEAFEVVKARFEEAVSEFQTAFEEQAKAATKK